MTSLASVEAVPPREIATISIVSLAHFVSHLLQLALAPLFIAMRTDLGASFTELGVVLSVFYLFSGAGQVVAGILVDRFGAHRLLIGGMALQAAAMGAMGLVPNYASLLPLAALAGLGNSVYHPADLSILSHRISPRRLGRAFALHVVGGSIGYAASPIVTGTLALFYGWRVALVATGLFCLLITAGFILARPLLRMDVVPPPARGHAMQDVAAPRFFDIMRMPVVLLAFFYFFLTAICLAGMQGFGISALREGFDMTPAFAAMTLALYQGGNICGILVGGYIADRARHHHRVAMTGLAAAAVVLGIVGLAQLHPFATLCLVVMAGAFIGITTPSRDVLVRHAAPENARGKVFGLVYSGFDVGSLIGPVIYGALLDAHLNHAVFLAAAAPLLVAVVTVIGVRVRPKTALSQG